MNCSSNHRPCRADGCTQLASSVSRFCRRHLKTYTQHGHTSGRAIRAHELKPYRALAAHLLSTYRARADVAAALRWLDKMLAAYPNAEAGGELARLRSGGVTAEEVFCASLAIWAFHRERPLSLPDDARLTFALGRAVVRLRRKPCAFAKKSLRLYTAYTSPKAFSYIGLRIREALPILFNRLIEMDEKSKQEEADLRFTIMTGESPR